jgi:hypothetical protein
MKNISEVEAPDTKKLKKFNSMFGKKTTHDDKTGMVNKSSKKDKSIPANKEKLSEGMGSEWTKHVSDLNNENEKIVKRTYGDYRTTTGKANKENIESIAASMNESIDDYRRIYAYSVSGILDEIEELAKTLEFHTLRSNGEMPTRSAYLDWKNTVRMLEDVRDKMLISVPEIAEGTDERPQDENGPVAVSENLQERASFNGRGSGKTFFVTDFNGIPDKSEMPSTWTLIKIGKPAKKDYGDAVYKLSGPSEVWEIMDYDIAVAKDKSGRPHPKDGSYGAFFDSRGNLKESEELKENAKILSAVLSGIKKEKIKTNSDLERYFDFTGGDIVAKHTKGDNEFNNVLNSIKAQVKKKLNLKESEELEESFSAGNIKLNDNSSVKLSATDAKLINALLSSSKNSDKMKQIMMKNSNEFKSLLSLAKEV